MKRRLLLAASSLLGIASGSTLFACGDYKGWDTGDPGTYADYTGMTYQDSDQDGFYEDEDCDDGDDAIHPGADEVCDDGVDNDCDGAIDGDDDDCA